MAFRSGSTFPEAPKSSTSPSSKLVAASVFLTSLILLIALPDPGLAAAWVDPVSQIRAQDEAVYSHTALRMATRGEWLTPYFLDRLALYKPPLLYWLSGLSAKVFGISKWSLRLPSMLAAALVAALVYWWTANIWCVPLIMTNYHWLTLGRLNMTDSILTLAIVAAVYVLHRDPRLERRSSLLKFGVASGAAILTKGAAGLVPVVILALFLVLGRERIAAGRLLLLAGVIAAVALPWYLYQFSVHPRWFWAEHILTEHVAYGRGSPPQTSDENQLWFYVRRLLLVSPALCLCAVAGLRRGKSGRLLAAWAAAILAGVLLYQYRNAAYLLPLVPALAIAAAPVMRWDTGLAASAMAAVCFPGYASELPAARVIEQHCTAGRKNELIVISPRDEFYSAALPFAKVRYLYVDAASSSPHYALDFRKLGIILPAGEFNRLESVRESYESRMREWGLENSDALATVVLARDQADVAAVIAENPAADFLLADGTIRLGRDDLPARSRRRDRGWCESLR